MGSHQKLYIGLDFGFLDNRLTGTAELFWKKCNNMLIDVTYPGTLGDKAPTQIEVVLRQTVGKARLTGRIK